MEATAAAAVPAPVVAQSASNAAQSASAVPGSSAPSVGSLRRSAKKAARALANAAGPASESDLLAAHPKHLCRFFLRAKRRHCAFAIAPPSEEHCAHHNAKEADKTDCTHCKTPIRNAAAAVTAEMTPASVDGVIADGASTVPSRSRLTPMAAHLLVCPKRLGDLACAALPFYSAGINGVWRSGSGVESEASDVNVSGAIGEDGHAPVSSNISSLADVPRDELWALIERLRDLARELGVDEDFVARTDAAAAAAAAAASSASETSTAVATASTTEPVLSAASRARHQLQHVGFFRLLEQHALLRRGSLVLEVGAGKAGLSGFLAQQVQDEEEGAQEEPKQGGTKRDQQHGKKRKMGADDSAVQPASAAADASAASAPATPAAPPAYTLVVLDRGSFKHKTDVSIRRSSTCALQRYRIDLQDTRLEAMDEVQAWSMREREAAAAAPTATTVSAAADGERPITMVIGKHVCGQATDFVCKAVARANNYAASVDGVVSFSATAVPSVAPPTQLVQCVAIATCCHHLCVWANYCNKEFMTSRGISPRAFHTMTRMSTWRTCGYKQHSEKKEQEDETMESTDATAAPASASASTSASATAPALVDPLHPTYLLSAAERVHIGAICKHLFDLGRVEYLRDQAHLNKVAMRTTYTTSAITKENFAILLA